MEYRYIVAFEVSGPLAMFARVDTGATPTSYPAPTWQSAKGLFESIAFFADGAAWICPTRVEICRRKGAPGGSVSYQKFAANYGGPLRKSNLFRAGSASGGSSMQIFATVLSNVCYRIHGAVVGPRASGPINARHYLKDLFDRRIKRGQCHRTPCLGLSEFTCDYVGPIRDQETEVDDALNLEIPSMLLSVWDRPVAGRYSPTFSQNVQIREGVLEYEVPLEWLSPSSETAVNHAQ